jgi:hypothetical protein
VVRADDDLFRVHRLSLEFFEDQDRVHPAEAEGIGHGGADLPFSCMEGNVIQIAIGSDNPG